MQKKTTKVCTIGISLLLLFPGCKTPADDPCSTEFDQLSLLTNIGTNIIVPAYQMLANQADTLNTYANTFTDNPDSANLNTLRNYFQQTWLGWQTATIFEFGPAATEDLRSFMNNFPVFITRMNDGIASGSFDLNSETYSYARGFPALDYLLYGIGATDADVLIQYTTNSSASNRKQYLKDATALISLKANTVYDAWKPDGANYLNTFTSTEGVANGKPLSDLVNQLNHGYEQFKKAVIPKVSRRFSGIKARSTTTSSQVMKASIFYCRLVQLSNAIYRLVTVIYFINICNTDA